MFETISSVIWPTWCKPTEDGRIGEAEGEGEEEEEWGEGVEEVDDEDASGSGVAVDVGADDEEFTAVDFMSSSAIISSTSEMS